MTEYIVVAELYDNTNHKREERKFTVNAAVMTVNASEYSSHLEFGDEDGNIVAVFNEWTYAHAERQSDGSTWVLAPVSELTKEQADKLGLE